MDRDEGRIGLVFLILLIVVLLIVRNQLFRGGLSSIVSPSVAEQIDRNAYQAVFLTGGQVFFGHLKQQGDGYFLLYDVFYLTAAEQGQQGQLVKRGNELQGPREPMIIPTRNALFIENLREDGDVAAAIHKFKPGQLPLATPPAVTAAPATTGPGTPRPSPTR